MVRDSAKRGEPFIDFWHLSSNGIIDKLVLRDLDLLFEGDEF